MRESLEQLPGHELTNHLYALRGQERHLLVELIGYLAEVNRRQLHVELGFSSLFGFCVEHLGLTKSSAYRRVTAARLLERFPVIADYLGDGRLKLTTLVELRLVLEEGNCVEILERAAGLCEERVKALVAALQPAAAPRDFVRRMPVAAAGGDQQQAAMFGSGAAPTPALARRARVEAINDRQHTIRVTVSQAFVDDLNELRAALSHVVPDGNLERILQQCMKVTLKRTMARRQGGRVARNGGSGTADCGRGAAEAPAAGNAPQESGQAAGKAPPSAATGRPHIPAEVRRAVWRRDRSRCSYVGPTGHGCGSRHRLEMHHVQPFSRGGACTVENLTLRCRAHNLYAARVDFGADFVERAIRLRQAALKVRRRGESRGR